MVLQEVHVKNFRLLRDASIALEGGTTVVVGRNNSGKTSLTELFRRLTSDSPPTFRFEDFSFSVHSAFWDAFVLYQEGKSDSEVRDKLPCIEVRATVKYSNDGTPLGPLTEFVIDLDTECTEAAIHLIYGPRPGLAAHLFDNISLVHCVTDLQKRVELCRALRERVPKTYSTTATAVDPNDPTNTRRVEWPKFAQVILGRFINAQRGLDDVTHKDSDFLGKVLEALFRTASSPTADDADRKLAADLEAAVTTVQADVQDAFNTQLEKLLPTFTLFGYPGLNDHPELGTETVLNVNQLLSNHTRVHYLGLNGVHLPESYNGLGTRNLIYILLRLHQFFKEYMSLEHPPSLQLIFIEEPEVHLHPQMQAVFISKLDSIVHAFTETLEEKRAWPVQFVVTTHSSHIANRAPFDTIRYFLATANSPADPLRSTRVKDLREGLADTPPLDRAFLHKYMTLTRCDLLFADKAILIEGESERLLLPQMIDILDEASPPNAPKLSSQYVSIVEVAGAHAHLFFDLLDFLELRTLIVTDLDSVKRNTNSRRVSCPVSEGEFTSNACLKKWFDDNSISPSALIAKTDAEKVNGERRIAFQVPEDDAHPCGRSFEAAFMLRNKAAFELPDGTKESLEAEVWSRSGAIEKKSDFAIDHGIRASGWQVPKYIADGLSWLASPRTASPIATLTEPPTDLVQAVEGPTDA